MPDFPVFQRIDMWCCFNTSFLSIVHKQCQPDELLVRARVAGHIEAVFPQAKVTESFGTDYRYRAALKRDEVAAAMVSAVMGLEYSNFKDSVENGRLHDAYSRVWHEMGRLQPGGPYSRGVARLS
jgi:hypothetical protein